MNNTKALKLATMLLDYLKSSEQLELLPDIIKTLSHKSKSLGLTQSAIVSSPVKLGTSEMKAITNFIAEKYGRDLQIVEKIDPELIAGFTIKVGDEVIDSSLATKLENIRKELV